MQDISQWGFSHSGWSHEESVADIWDAVCLVAFSVFLSSWFEVVMGIRENIVKACWRPLTSSSYVLCLIQDAVEQQLRWFRIRIPFKTSLKGIIGWQVHVVLVYRSVVMPIFFINSCFCTQHHVQTVFVEKLFPLVLFGVNLTLFITLRDCSQNTELREGRSSVKYMPSRCLCLPLNQADSSYHSHHCTRQVELPSS